MGHHLVDHYGDLPVIGLAGILINKYISQGQGDVRVFIFQFRDANVGHGIEILNLCVKGFIPKAG